MSIALDSPITVVLASDSLLVGDGLMCVFEQKSDVKVVGRARDPEMLIDLVDEFEPDAVILSIRSPVVTSMATIRAARSVREHHPDLGVVVISDRGNGFALELLRGGANRVAYLVDEHLLAMDTVMAALYQIRAGNTVLDATIVDALVRRRDNVSIDELTTREVDVLEKMAHGLSNRAIGTAIHVSIKAIERQVTSVYAKLGLTDHETVDRRVAAVLIYLHAESGNFSSAARRNRSAPRSDAVIDLDEEAEHEEPVR
jgi:DNA-binding NarL/FixJ family response regulator